MSVKKLFLYFLAAGLLTGDLAHAQLTMPVITNDGIEAQVEAYFADAPEMTAIAKCESGFRQFTASGAPLAGGTGGNYIGVFQISIDHVSEAQALGMDIYTTDGNLAYAKYLYQKQGTSPWSGCVNIPVAAPVAPAGLAFQTGSAATTTIPASGTLISILKTGMVSPEVMLLQQLLNADGFTVAISGPGSPGNETAKFGALTRAAVQRFQCAKNIVCSGSELTTGYGLVGPRTRAALLGQN